MLSEQELFPLWSRQAKYKTFDWKGLSAVSLGSLVWSVLVWMSLPECFEVTPGHTSAGWFTNFQFDNTLNICFRLSPSAWRWSTLFYKEGFCSGFSKSTHCWNAFTVQTAFRYWIFLYKLQIAGVRYILVLEISVFSFNNLFNYFVPSLQYIFPLSVSFSLQQNMIMQAKFCTFVSCIGYYILLDLEVTFTHVCVVGWSRPAAKHPHSCLLSTPSHPTAQGGELEE